MADRRYPPEDTETVFCLERKYKTNDKESVGIDFGTTSKAYNRKETKTKTKKLTQQKPYFNRGHTNVIFNTFQKKAIK